MAIGQQIRFLRSKNTDEDIVDQAASLSEQGLEDKQALEVELDSSTSSLGPLDIRLSSYDADVLAQPLVEVRGPISDVALKSGAYSSTKTKTLLTSPTDTPIPKDEHPVNFVYIKRAGKTWSTIASASQSPTLGVCDEDISSSFPLIFPTEDMNSKSAAALPEAQVETKPSDPADAKEQSIRSSQINVSSKKESKHTKKLQESAIETFQKSMAAKDTSSYTNFTRLPISDSVQKSTANSLHNVAASRGLKKMRISTKAQDALLDIVPGGSQPTCVILQQTGASFSTALDDGGKTATVFIRGSPDQITAVYDLMLIHTQKYPLEVDGCATYDS